MTDPTSDTETVSAVITTKDRPDFLELAVASVVAQSYRPLELIIIDDGSQPPVSREILGPLNGISVRIVCNDRSRGVSASRNLGARLAEGRFIAFLDDDDQWLPTKIAEQMTWVGNPEKNYSGCGCLMEVYDHFGNLMAKPIRSSRREEIISNLLYRDENIVPSTLLFDREKFLALGGYREDMPVAEDCEFLLRFLLRHDFTVLPAALLRFTEHKGARLTRNFAAGYEGEAKYRDFVFEHRQQLDARKRDLGYRNAKAGHQAMLAGKWLTGLREFAAGLLLYPWDRRVFFGTILSLSGPATYRRVMSTRMERIR